jgi:hypothetical protein
MSRIKKAYLGIMIVMLGGMTFAAVPNFDDDFAKYLTSTTPDAQGRVETVFSLCIDKNLSLMENIKNLFYPSTITNPSSPCGGQPGGQLRGVVQTLGVAIIFLFLVLAGVKFIMEAKSADGPKKAASSLFYMAY